MQNGERHPNNNSVIVTFLSLIFGPWSSWHHFLYQFFLFGKSNFDIFYKNQWGSLNTAFATFWIITRKNLEIRGKVQEIRSDNFLFRLSRPVFPKIKTNLFICYYFISFIMLQTPDFIKRLIWFFAFPFSVTPNKKSRFLK